MRAFFSILFFCSTICLFAEAAAETEKPRVLLFPLNIAEWDLPQGESAEADRIILSAFEGMGSFDVGRCEAQPSGGDFPNLLSAAQEAAGSEGADYCLYLAVENYTARRVHNEYRTELSLSAVFFSPVSAVVLGRFSIRTIGLGGSAAESFTSAIEDAPAQLVLKIRSLPGMNAGGDILAVRGRTVLLNRGRSRGITPGDEFLLEKRRDSGGGAPSKAAGLLAVKEIEDEVSFADVIYGDPEPGDSLRAVQRLGIDALFYARAVITADGAIIPVVGLQAAGTGRNGGFRPLAGIQLPFYDPLLARGVPVFPYFGIEMSWVYGRMQILPMITLGGGGVFSSGTGSLFTVTHYGGEGGAAISYLLNPCSRVWLSAGYCSWIGTGGLEAGETYDYNGVTLSGGIVWKM